MSSMPSPHGAAARERSPPEKPFAQRYSASCSHREALRACRFIAMSRALLPSCQTSSSSGCSYLSNNKNPLFVMEAKKSLLHKPQTGFTPVCCSLSSPALGNHWTYSRQCAGLHKLRKNVIPSLCCAWLRYFKCIKDISNIGHP